MFKRLESPRMCAQLFHASSWRNESVCWSFEVEIKTADFYSLHKQRYCILHLFICRVLAFSQFPVGTYIKTQTHNLHGGDAKNFVLISLPRLREVDILHKTRLLRDYRWIVCPRVYYDVFRFTACAYISSSEWWLSGCRLNQLCLQNSRLYMKGG